MISALLFLMLKLILLLLRMLVCLVDMLGWMLLLLRNCLMESRSWKMSRRIGFVFLGNFGVVGVGGWLVCVLEVAERW